MLNKKAIQLSVNFLVVVILSLVMLGMGMFLLTQFFDFGEEIKDQISEKEEEAIEAALQQGELISIPLYSKTVEKGETELFGYGVYNVEVPSDFKIVDVGGIDENGESFSTDDWLVYDDSEFYLEKNEQKKGEIAVTVPDDAVIGTYVFTFEVKRKDGGDWERYPLSNSVMKIYVKVR